MSSQPICSLSKTLYNSYNLPEHFRLDFLQKNLKKFENLIVTEDLFNIESLEFGVNDFNVKPVSDSDLAMTDCLDDILLPTPALCKHITPYDKVSESDKVVIEKIYLDHATFDIKLEVQAYHFEEVEYFERIECSVFTEDFVYLEGRKLNLVNSLTKVEEIDLNGERVLAMKPNTARKFEKRIESEVYDDVCGIFYIFSDESKFGDKGTKIYLKDTCHTFAPDQSTFQAKPQRLRSVPDQTLTLCHGQANRGKSHSRMTTFLTEPEKPQDSSDKSDLNIILPILLWCGGVVIMVLIGFGLVKCFGKDKLQMTRDSEPSTQITNCPMPGMNPPAGIIRYYSSSPRLNFINKIPHSEIPEESMPSDTISEPSDECGTILLHGAV